MNRVTFVAVYALGVGLVWLAGSPWLLVNAMIMGAPKWHAMTSLNFWLGLLVPLALIVVAAMRGRAAARPRLVLFPVFAFGLSTLAFAYGWLSRIVSGEEASLLPMQLAVAIGVTSFFGPLVIHVICCAIGVTDGPSKPPRRAMPLGLN